MPGRINRQREGRGGGAKINREEARINRGRKRGARITRKRGERELTERKQELTEKERKGGRD